MVCSHPSLVSLSRIVLHELPGLDWQFTVGISSAFTESLHLLEKVLQLCMLAPAYLADFHQQLHGLVSLLLQTLDLELLLLLGQLQSCDFFFQSSRRLRSVLVGL